MAFEAKPIKPFQYRFEGNHLEVLPKSTGFNKIANQRFKDDTETWLFTFEAKLVNESTVKWNVFIYAGLSYPFDLSHEGAYEVPKEIEVTADAHFVVDHH